MAVQNVQDSEFKETITQDRLVLIDFWAPWCGPCKMMAPVLDELDQQAGNRVSVMKLNVDDNPDTASACGVMSIPTLKFFKNGEELHTAVGLRGLPELLQLVDQYA
jgi:thioredoxin 1